MRHIVNVLMITVVVILLYTFMLAVIPKRPDRVIERVKPDVITDTVYVKRPNILDYE